MAIHPDHPDAPKPQVNWPEKPVEGAIMHPDHKDAAPVRIVQATKEKHE